MSLQARVKDDGSRLYSPARDLAYCFKELMQNVLTTLQKRQGEDIPDLIKRYGVTSEQLDLACSALLGFILSSVEVPAESMADNLDRFEWFSDKIGPGARLAVTAALGRATVGMSWAGVREATISGQGPLLEYQDLRRAGEEFSWLMRTPHWRRGLNRYLLPLRRAWRALWGSK